MEVLIPSLGLLFILAIIGVAALLWLFALIDILRSEFRNPNDKLLWVVVVFFFPFLGAVLYFIIGRNNKIN